MMNKQRKMIIVGLGLLFFLLFPLIFKRPMIQHMMILIFLYALMGMAWNILGGYAGQVSLGHAVYFGLGAYTSTCLLMWYNLSPWVGMIPGIIIAVAVSMIIGYPCFRLKGHYFAIATICVGEIIHLLFLNWPLVEEPWVFIFPSCQILSSTSNFTKTRFPITTLS